MRKHVTSGIAHLCALATQFSIPKKKMLQWWRASHANSDVFKTTTLSSWYKASLNLNFPMFCTSSKLLKIAWFHLLLLYHKITAKNRSCSKSVMKGRLQQTLIQAAD